MHTSRGGAAAVLAHARPAGTIASSQGNVTDTPSPFSTVRRDRCFCVFTIDRYLLDDF
jgi:hypothetical protein